MDKAEANARELISELIKDEGKLKNKMVYLLRKTNILKDGFSLDDGECGLVNNDSKNINYCFYGCVIPPNKSSLSKMVNVMIRPDFNKHARVLRGLVQIGNEVISFKANRDRFKRSLEELFEKEKNAIFSKLERKTKRLVRFLCNKQKKERKKEVPEEDLQVRHA